MKGYVILIAAVAALGGLLFGFDTAVIAGTLRYLTHYFSLSNSALGLIVAAASIGCIPGALVAGRLADRYGRKIMLIVTSLLYIVAALGPQPFLFMRLSTWVCCSSSIGMSSRRRGWPSRK
jgi:MFS family permease